jgi:hypothetical protein
MFRANVEPYVGPDAIETLRKKVGDIEGWAKNLELERARVGSPTAPAPPILDIAGYLQSRVYQQINGYYRPNAKKNAELAERFRWRRSSWPGSPRFSAPARHSWALRARPRWVRGSRC